MKKKSHISLFGTNQDYLTYKDSCNTFISDKVFQLSNLYKFNGGNGIVTNKYISKFTELENLFYRLIDRVAIRPLPTIQKRKFYFEILKYWKNFFENNEIDKIIFCSHPHTYKEITPFFLAKDLGIKTYIMKLTSIPNFVFLDTSLNEPGRYINLENRYDENYSYIKNVLSTKEVYGKDKRANSLNKIKHVDLLNNPLKYFNSRISSINKLFSLKKKKYYLTYNLKFSEFIVELFKRDYQKTILRRYLKNNSKEPNLNKKFIYFALHYQPERSTDPQSSYYSDQLVPLNILNRLIPDDYVIYVKEHPRQLNDNFPDIRKKHFRNIKFYDEILKFDKVSLIDINFPSKKLIENSKLNCSCTGSNVWEGLYNFRKPGIHFGHSWLSLCKSTPSVIGENESQIKNTIKTLLKKTSKDINNDYDEFLKNISKYGIITSNIAPYDKLVSEENMVKNFVDVIESINDFK